MNARLERELMRHAAEKARIRQQVRAWLGAALMTGLLIVATGDWWLQ